jgi:hypothetical protein
MMEVLPLNLCLSCAISEKSTFAFLFCIMCYLSNKENLAWTITMPNPDLAGGPGVTRKWRRNRLKKLD